MKLNNITKYIKKLLKIFLSQKAKKRLAVLAFFTICLAILLLTIRGLPGNPTSSDLNGGVWTAVTGPFESSNERGRYALMHSIVEDKTFYLSPDLARFSTPDLAINSDGEFVALFAPGVSFLTIPGYVIGKMFNHAQLGAYAVITMYALLNIILIYLIAMRMRVGRIASALAGIVFLFATPAFAYAVTMYQHHISTFFILISIYALLRLSGWRSLVIVWFFCALSIVVDSPNFFMMFPLGLFAFARIFIIKKRAETIKVRIKPALLLALLIMIIPVSVYLGYNKFAHGDFFQISGTLPRVTDINDQGQAVQMGELININEEFTENTEDKKAVSFFKTRYLLNGFYTHVLSPDRGMVEYTPIILFGLWGMVIAYRRNKKIANLLAMVMAANFLLYSMWGDPYGGWSFGSRYLIPSYAILAIAIAFLLKNYRRNLIVLILFIVLFISSARICSLGAITSNINPPRIEVLALEKVTGKEEKFTYERNKQFLQETGTKSYVYHKYLSDNMSAATYYNYISGIIILLGFSLSSCLYVNARKQKSS